MVLGLDPLFGTFEHQRKFKCSNLEIVRDLLISLGASVKLANNDEYDRFYTKAEKTHEEAHFIKIRQREPSLDNLLILQGKNQELMIPLEIHSAELAESFIVALGYRFHSSFRKYRTMFILGDMNVKLDTVEGVGDFVEFGTFYSNPDLKAVVEKTVTDLVEKLSPVLSAESDISYSDLADVA